MGFSTEIATMTPSLSQVIQVLGQPSPPKQITQQPFDYDSSHYRRLCQVNGAAPTLSDLSCYVDDMRFMPLQPDLLRYLLPQCLKMWQEDLLSGSRTGCGGTVEAFWAALSPHPPKTAFLLEEELTAKEYGSVMRFMRDTLLTRMSQETQLYFAGSNSSPYQWFYALGSFSNVFPALDSLWNEWWQLNTLGHAVCVLQYFSCLMYPSDKNPVFAPWTPDSGGGPPELSENDALVSEAGWRRENIAFLAETLTLNAVYVKLQAAAAICTPFGAGLPERILADWPRCQELAATQIAGLPKLLA